MSPARLISALNIYAILSQCKGQPLPANQEYLELKNLILGVFTTLIIMTILTVITGILSDSLTVGAIAVDAGSSLILHLFNMISIRVILRQNAFSFPYGTGKLENFSGFLYAAVVIPGALLIIYSAVKRYFHPTVTISFGPVQALLLLWIVRDVAMLVWSSRLCRRFPDHSPMTRSYLVNMKVTVIYSVAMFAGLLFGFWMSSLGKIELAIVIDLVIAVLAALYMIYGGVSLLIVNFRSLIDMPLPEEDQYAILNALVADFDAYEGIGNIYSQLSGNTRLIQIELYVNEATTAGDIEGLRGRIEERLQGRFSKLLFHLIPLIKKDKKTNAVAEIHSMDLD
jgi:divalent metal cation (Fe/Co/Zn/Cd) transporter